MSGLRNAGEESGFYGAVEGWIPPATPSGSIGGRTPPPTVRSEGLCSPAFRKVGSLWNLDKQLGVLHRRHSHWPGRKRSVVRTTACLAIWLLKTTATRNRCRFQILFKSVNRQILLRKSFNNSTMIISHPFLPYRFHCLNQNCEKLILRGKIFRDTSFECHRPWSNLDSACRTRGQIDIIHRNLRGKPQHILGSLPLSAIPEHYLAGQSLSPTPPLPDRVCQNAS